jgi:hypothetical protein
MLDQEMFGEAIGGIIRDDATAMTRWRATLIVVGVTR